MIPIRLEIRDFLSYAEPPPLDFTDFDIACLTGDNGAGKSALLDALTFALFGAARGCEGGVNQDRLIRDGADETLVDLTFSLGGSVHRIVRRRTRKGKGEVRFMIADGDSWTNVAGETIRETEAHIASVLRMDYRTFTASAFFVQGRSEDFLSRLGPEQRKEVFVRLLDLGVYEQLEDTARARARDAERRRAEHAEQIQQLESSPTDVEALERELAQAERDVEAKAAGVEAKLGEVDGARVIVSDLEKVEAVLTRERSGIAETEQAVRDAEQSLTDKRQQIADMDDLLARADEVREAVAEATTLRESEEAARAAQVKAAELDRRSATVAQALVAEEKAITHRLEEGTRRLGDLEQERQGFASAQAQIDELERSLAGAEGLDASLDENAAQLDEARTFIAHGEANLLSLKDRSAEIKDRVALLAGGGGECPLCGGALDATHRADAKRKLQAQARQIKLELDATKAAVDTATKESKRFTEEGQRMKRALAERTSASSQRDALLAKLERAPIVREEIEALESQRLFDQRALAEQGFAPELREELEALKHDLVAVYDAEAHAEMRRRLTELQPYEQLHGRLEEASTRRKLVDEEAASLTKRLEDATSALERRSKEAAALDKSLETLPAARRRLSELDAELAGLREAAADRRSDVVRIGERLEGARRAAAALEAERAHEVEAAGQHRSYRRLTEAFGRGGIPDLIIDNALPELEEEANQILGSLSDYEMSVHFAMQRETKSGKARDTFDVLVHHDGGVRDFAMFSGGEAFRIAFAVRLAMSKLLVRRAGARLETLVVDEGFGTQDPQGRERLIGALNVARREFAKVLVITHLDDLKDLFEAEIRVWKDPQRGSAFELGQG
ncbi:MAG: SMC family ATPase [Actinomycetota bacterium]